MEINSRKEMDCLVLAVKGRLDTFAANEFEQGVTAHQEDGERKVILDLSAMDYISSAGLRCIMSLYKRLKEAGGSLAVCGLDGLPKRVFEVSGFDQFLPSCGDVAQAAEAIKKP